MALLFVPSWPLKFSPTSGTEIKKNVAAVGEDDRLQAANQRKVVARGIDSVAPFGEPAAPLQQARCVLFFCQRHALASVLAFF